MNHYVIICGGRDPDDNTLQAVDDVIRFLHMFYGTDLRVMHGDATGVDTAAAEACDRLGVKVKAYPADWARGRGAGPERNKKMAQLLIDWAQLGHSTEVIAFKGGRGTEHMATFAGQCGLNVTRIPEPGTDKPQSVDLEGQGMSNYADGTTRQGRKRSRTDPEQPRGLFDTAN